MQQKTTTWNDKNWELLSVLKDKLASKSMPLCSGSATKSEKTTEKKPQDQNNATDRTPSPINTRKHFKAVQNKPSKSRKLQNTEPIRKHKKQRKLLVCVLCAAELERGDLLRHKLIAHGEQMVVPSPATWRNDSKWVSIFQGGLPSLGKRSR
jgi:hypothetical protein